MTDGNERFNMFFVEVSKVINGHMEERFPTLPKCDISFTEGRKYFKIVKSGSVFAFVNKENGDVLMPASWAAPAKHARGNIYDDDIGMSRVGPYGPAYL